MQSSRQESEQVSEAAVTEAASVNAEGISEPHAHLLYIQLGGVVNEGEAVVDVAAAVAV
jgi:hypothetical protein